MLDVSSDGKMLLVANTDNGTVSVVDLITSKVLREIVVGDHPEAVSWLGSSKSAIVTVYRDDKVLLLDAETGKVTATIKTEAEPYGVVTTKNGSKAYVSHDYPGVISEIDVASQKVVRTMSAGKWARGLAISPDEKTLYCSNFFTADLTALDVGSGKIKDSWPGKSIDNLARNVVVHPSRPKAYLPHIRSRVHVFDARGSIIPELSVVSTHDNKEEKRRGSLSLDTFNGVYVVANPWEAAISPDGKQFFIVYSGTDDMNYCTVVDDDYREVEQAGVIRVGKHPRAVIFSPDSKRAYVYNTMDFQVQVLDTTGSRPRTLQTITVCDPPHTPEWVRGKILFQTANPPLTRAKWISCSSCHPDGAQDGRIWQNPEGDRRTPPLFGLAHTHPLHWSADRDEVQDFEYTIRGKLMAGRGLALGAIKPRTEFLKPSELEEKLSGRSKDLDALAIYTNSFQPKLSPHIPEPGKLSESALRGKELFFSKEVACATCHSGSYYTDSTLQKPFKLHDVGTGGDEREKMGSKYDTPTLIGVYRNDTFLHDGRAKSLLEVLTVHNKNDAHGKTSHLKPEQLEDLVAFMKSLPYETPPDNTPNTVPHRVILQRPEKTTTQKEPSDAGGGK
ncbi:MAG: beta-propeller fold lactonase family protein [Zavarzinella sp.]